MRALLADAATVLAAFVVIILPTALLAYALFR